MGLQQKDVISTAENAHSIAHQRKPLTMEDLTPILFGASAFQYLNAACDIGLLDLLHEKPNLSKEEIAKKLNLQHRAIDILLLGTNSLGLTEKTEQGYVNADVIEQLIAGGQWQIFKDVVGFEQHVVYEGQVDFSESLKTNSNVGIRRIRGSGRDLYHRLSENPHMEQAFYNYMHSWSELSNPLLWQHADFSNVKKVIDVGGGTGVNAIALAEAFPHLEITILEIAGTVPIARQRIAKAGLEDRIHVVQCDMFHDHFPQGHDCVLFSHQLVIWTPEQNIELLKKAQDVLPAGGKVIIFNSISNDKGDGPLMAALDSVYFAAIPAEGGMIYAWHQYMEWLDAAGFKDAKAIDCEGWTPHGIIEATK
ncbi:methyltransferase [Zooshikella sp. RANM57]|uniref:methyltransferase n=1 Tax=Zooshikella sp. RANM57 TaxID=3425863 RepID=UPI003D6F95BC